MNKIFTFCMMLMALASCKKDPQSVFSGKDGITFFYKSGQEQDSVSYSFKLNQPKTRDTVWIKMRLVGKLSGQQRQIKIVAGAGTTATEGKHFILPDFYLPADSFQVKYPLVLLSTTDLNSKAVRLVMQVAESKDLIIGTRGQADVSTANTVAFKVNFSNRLIKPDYWNYISYYIGEYSEVRYQFMIDTFGMSDFRPDTKGGIITYAQWVNIKGKLRNALDAYVSKNGPLIDENGGKVEFPL
ncbi:hypothetical protein ABIE26_001132 [Pedobacter africanus]|uniref:Uncharacterized protein n=1 Tax=Pedobacter africanus TaxID=151894 RepID=A0ACC6KSQ1_9SPHI|nr:DUF4843 domain-containing protein [Pedobacter africanus]MDR6782380.1 hypothetical protein [Pedobacter africanus]